jgi:hypothetical protein
VLASASTRYSAIAGAPAKLTTAPPTSARSLSSGQDRDKIPIGVRTILCIDHPLRSRRLLEHTADRYRNHNDMIRNRNGRTRGNGHGHRKCSEAGKES